MCGKMDSSGPADAATAEEYVYGGTADWRTDLYQYPCPTIPTHKESIELIKSLGGKFTPELKGASVEMPFEGTFDQEAYGKTMLISCCLVVDCHTIQTHIFIHLAQKMIDEYIELGIPPEDVWPQSFNSSDGTSFVL